jgi:Dolichyl-phosphate-mannose-protein mannosyltransferase
MSRPSHDSTADGKRSGLRAWDPNRVSVILFSLTFVACVAWAIISSYIAPGVIRSAYHGSGWLVFRLFVDPARHPLAHYLARWHSLARLTLLALSVSGISALVVARPEFQNGFWGPEPSNIALGARTLNVVKFSWRDKLASYARSWEAVAIFAVIALLGILLRLHCLGAKSLDQDEIFSARLALDRLSDSLWVVTHKEANMISYYALLRLWIHLGQSELTIRMLSVLPALATLPAIYLIGSRTFGKQVGTVAALLLAINGFHIEYSQDARAYSLLAFLVTLSSLFFLRCLREGSRRNWTWYIVSSTLAIYTHIFAVLVLIAQWVFVLFLPHRQAPWRRLIPSTAAIGLLALPMELFVIFRAQGQLSWVPKTTARSIYEAFACLAGKPFDFSFAGYSAPLLLLVYSIVILLGVLSIAKRMPLSMAQSETQYVAFFMSWLLVPILLLLAISIRHPTFYPRFVIICLPPFILLGSYGILRVRRPWLVISVVCLLAALTVPGLLSYYDSPGEDWRGAARYVLSNEEQGDATVFFPDYFQSRFEYYLQQETPKRPEGSEPSVASFVLPPDRSVGSFLAGLPTQYHRVWFISEIPNLERSLRLKQESLTGASLAAQFPGMKREKQFSDELIVVLCQR